MSSTLLNISEWASGGFAETQHQISTSGKPYDSSTLDATEIQGMTRVKGGKSANISIPEAEILQIPGDDGVLGVLQFPGNALPEFDLVTSALNLAFVNTAQGTITVNAQNVYDFLILDPANRVFRDIFLMLTRRALSLEAGSTGNGYESIIFPQATVSFSGVGQMQTGANEGEYTCKVTANRASVLPWGTALSTGTHGTTGAGAFMFWSQYIPTWDVAKKDGIITSWNLTKTFAANAQIIAWKNVSGTVSTDTVTADTANNQADGVAAGSSGDTVTFLYEKSQG